MNISWTPADSVLLGVELVLFICFMLWVFAGMALTAFYKKKFFVEGEAYCNKIGAIIARGIIETIELDKTDWPDGHYYKKMVAASNSPKPIWMAVAVDGKIAFVFGENWFGTNWLSDPVCEKNWKRMLVRHPSFFFAGWSILKTDTGDLQDAISRHERNMKETICRIDSNIPIV